MAPVNRNLEQLEEGEKVQGIGRSNHGVHGEMWKWQDNKKTREGSSNQMKDVWARRHNHSERSKEGSSRGKVVTQTKALIPFGSNIGGRIKSDMGQNLEAQPKREKDWDNGLCEMLKRMDGSESLLKARQEKLLKAQIKYWVDFEDDEDEGPKQSGEMIPVQPTVIKEIADGLREVSLKRKAEDMSESPLSKRRRDYDQDSPRVQKIGGKQKRS